jgi:hypothetical protein
MGFAGKKSCVDEYAIFLFLGSSHYVRKEKEMLIYQFLNIESNIKY